MAGGSSGRTMQTRNDIVSERLGPHPGPREMRREGLCGVQGATWGRRKAARPGPPLGHCRGRNRARTSLMQRGGSPPWAQSRQWPFKAPGAFRKVRAESQSGANSGD